MTRSEQLKACIKDMEANIKSAIAWDIEHSCMNYRSSGQAASDRKYLQIWNRELKSIQSPASTIKFVSVVPFGFRQ